MSEMNQGAASQSTSGASGEPETPATGGPPDASATGSEDQAEQAGGATADTPADAGDAAGGEAVPAEGSVDGTTRTTLDALLAGEQGPDWLTARLELDQAREITDDDLKAMDPTSKRVTAELMKRHEAARKELEAEARKLDEQRQTFEASQRIAARKEAKSLEWANNPLLRQLVEGMTNAEAPPDPTSIEGIRHQARVETAQALQEFLDKFSTVQKETAEYAELKEQEAAQAEADAAEVAYIEQNIETFRDPEIAQATKMLVNKGLSLEEAHGFALAKVNDTRASDPNQSAADRAVELARRRIASGGQLPNTIPETPEGLSIAEKNAFWEANPGSMKRDIARKRARSGY